MKICKACKEVTCIGYHRTLKDKIERKFYGIKWKIKDKLSKTRNLDEYWKDSWKDSYEIKNEYEDDNWNNKSYEKLNILTGFNFEKEVLKDFKEIFLSEKSNKWKEHEKVEIPVGVIRYSQRRINLLFQSRNGEVFRRHITEVVNELRDGKIVYDINLPIIEIVIEGNKVYSMDNRRLYCLKEVFEENVKICYKYRKNNQNFRRKRIQVEMEREELGESDNFDYRNVIIDMYARGRLVGYHM
ncbi:hypothetical protein C1645_862261 [Glomus cerebriforme]|uniref:Uncharacterized protein n=1 Tax=Glomus cerebriforme TaxID=658196 RepID=A0A397SCT6_9GLOM|nr:hypothetical protein C1645_862261 [Glomus cerebriforme]